MGYSPMIYRAQLRRPSEARGNYGRSLLGLRTLSTHDSKSNSGCFWSGGGASNGGRAAPQRIPPGSCDTPVASLSYTSGLMCCDSLLHCKKGGGFVEGAIFWCSSLSHCSLCGSLCQLCCCFSGCPTLEVCPSIDRRTWCASVRPDPIFLALQTSISSLVLATLLVEEWQHSNGISEWHFFLCCSRIQGTSIVSCTSILARLLSCWHV